MPTLTQKCHFKDIEKNAEWPYRSECMAIIFFIHLLLLILVSKLFMTTYHVQKDFHKVITCMTSIEKTKLDPKECHTNIKKKTK
jgi:hypothetical protein